MGAGMNAKRRIEEIFQKLKSEGGKPAPLDPRMVLAIIDFLDELTGPGVVEFGLDSEDSEQLEELRRALDDHLVWPAGAQEKGDYIAAVVHNADLLAESRRQVQVLLTERQQLRQRLEITKRVHGLDCDLPVPLTDKEIRKELETVGGGEYVDWDSVVRRVRRLIKERYV